MPHDHPIKKLDKNKKKHEKHGDILLRMRNLNIAYIYLESRDNWKENGNLLRQFSFHYLQFIANSHLVTYCEFFGPFSTFTLKNKIKNLL